jgi:hypothetical protein
LKEEKLSELEQLFRENDINGEALLTISETDWKELIPAMGKR